MSEKSKKPIDVMLDAVVWEAVPPSKTGSGLPYPTHKGILEIAGYKLNVLVLSTGERVIEEQSLIEFFGGKLK